MSHQSSDARHEHDEAFWSSTDDEDHHRLGGGGGGAAAASDSRIIDPEEWCSAYEDDLLDLYEDLRDRCQLRGCILDRMSYSDFVEFAFGCSSGYGPPR